MHPRRRWRLTLPLWAALLACEANEPTAPAQKPPAEDAAEDASGLDGAEIDAPDVTSDAAQDASAPPALPDEPFGPAPARPAPPVREVRAWILLSDDPEAVARNIARAPGFGVEEIHLSHDLISTIDKLRGEKAAPLLQVIEDAKARFAIFETKSTRTLLEKFSTLTTSWL